MLVSDVTTETVGSVDGVVLILVLVDVGLGHAKLGLGAWRGNVLILVLVDVGLGL